MVYNSFSFYLIAFVGLCFFPYDPARYSSLFVYTDLTVLSSLHGVHFV